MSENEVNELIDKIKRDETIDISLLTEEQKESLKAFIKKLGEAIGALADYILNVLVPIAEKCVKAISEFMNKQNKDYSRQVINAKMLIKWEIRPLYLDQRRDIHICSRSSC